MHLMYKAKLKQITNCVLSSVFDFGWLYCCIIQIRNLVFFRILSVDTIYMAIGCLILSLVFRPLSYKNTQFAYHNREHEGFKYVSTMPAFVLNMSFCVRLFICMCLVSSIAFTNTLSKEGFEAVCNLHPFAPLLPNPVLFEWSLEIPEFYEYVSSVRKPEPIYTMMYIYMFVGIFCMIFCNAIYYRINQYILVKHLCKEDLYGLHTKTSKSVSTRVSDNNEVSDNGNKPA